MSLDYPQVVSDGPGGFERDYPRNGFGFPDLLHHTEQVILFDLVQEVFVFFAGPPQTLTQEIQQRFVEIAFYRQRRFVRVAREYIPYLGGEHLLRVDEVYVHLVANSPVPSPRLNPLR